MLEALVVGVKNVGGEAGLIVRNEVKALDHRDVGKRSRNASDSLLYMLKGSEVIFGLLPIASPDGSDGKYF